MSRKTSVSVLVLVLILAVAVGGWVMAQQIKPEAPAVPAAAPETGPYMVSASDSVTVLLDTKTGKTWTLAQSVGGSAVWLPTQQTDDLRVASKFLSEQHDIRKKMVEEEKRQQQK
jgi:hypothetical protein